MPACQVVGEEDEEPDWIQDGEEVGVAEDDHSDGGDLPVEFVAFDGADLNSWLLIAGLHLPSFVPKPDVVKDVLAKYLEVGKDDV